MANPVFFADMRAKSLATSTVGKVERLLARLEIEKEVHKGDLTAIKVHFGELGNDSYVNPVFARKVSDAVRAAGGKPFFTDTNTLYTGSRSNGPEHLETAITHGYDFSVCGAPLVIADGIKSHDWREVSISQKWFDKVKIASAILDADSMVVISHFKGHEMAGFGGAIKNLAMGCAPAIGKRYQHSCRFFVRQKICVGCGACARVCPAGAPLITEDKAKIDREKCIGCGECALQCPVKAITMDWKVEIAEFTEKLTEYALGAVKGKVGRILYLTFVRDVIPECDCAPWSDAPLVADIGILAGTDPVAIDQAALDLVTAAPAASGSIADGKAGPGEDKFLVAHPETRGIIQLEHGAEIGLGSREYDLVKI